MFRRVIIFSVLLLFLLIAAAAWNIRQAGKPMSADEIPQWELVQETQDSILLQSAAEPDRKTEAFLAGPSDRFGCDTLIMLAGAETGPDFFQLSPEIVEKANTILLIQPFQNFAKYLEKPEDINGSVSYTHLTLPTKRIV